MSAALALIGKLLMLYERHYNKIQDNIEFTCDIVGIILLLAAPNLPVYLFMDYLLFISIGIFSAMYEYVSISPYPNTVAFLSDVLTV